MKREMESEKERRRGKNRGTGWGGGGGRDKKIVSTRVLVSKFGVNYTDEWSGLN